MPAGSRIETARRRVRIARYSIGAVATAAFALIGLAARDAHPATHGSSPTTVEDVTQQSQQDDAFGFDGGGFISPSTSSSPSIQSGGS
jgi:hypothetical protein